MSATSPTGGRAWLVRVAALLAIVAGVPAIAPGCAFAHAVVVGSIPADGADLSVSPTSFELDFDEPVEVASDAVRVFDANNQRVDQGRTTARQSAVVAQLRADLPRGVYTATYRVVSDDGHPVTGAVTFGVRQAVGAADRRRATALVARRTGSPTVEGLYGIIRGLHFTALMLLIGAVVVRLFVWPANAKRRWPVRIVAGTVAVGAGCAYAAVALQGVLDAGAPLSRTLDLSLLRDSVHTRAGETWLVRGLVWAFAGALITQFPRMETRRKAVAVALPALVLVASLPFAGHAATNSPAALLAVADVVHVLAAGAWLGGLALLMACFWPRRGIDLAPDTAEATARFSKLALPAIVALMAGGAVQAWFLLGSPAALWRHGTWALALTAKTVLLGAILVLGARNRRRTARLPDHPGATAPALRRAMRAEVVFGVLMLAATATLVRSVPPVDAARRPVVREVLTGPLRTRLELPSARVGTVQILVSAVDPRASRRAVPVADGPTRH
jgi:copper transport protein